MELIWKEVSTMAANDNQADMNQHMNDPSQHPALSLSATFLKPLKEQLSGQEYESLQWLASLRTGSSSVPIHGALRGYATK